MLPQQPVRFSPMRPRRVSCIPVLVFCALIALGNVLYRGYQEKQFDKYSLPEASYFARATNVETFYIDNPTTEEGRKQAQTGVSAGRQLAMDLGHLVLDNVGSATPTLNQEPLYDFRVFRGDKHIDVLVSKESNEFWIIDGASNAPLTPIENGVSGRCVASGNFGKDSAKMVQLEEQAFPPANDDSNDNEPPD
jgi:hypothetical protein